MDFYSIYRTISSLVASAMTKLSCNGKTNDIEELVFNSDSGEQCSSDVSDIEHSA
jgi:hypothetical protein